MPELVDWDRWHDPYADPTSGLSRRLLVIKAALTDWLDNTAPEPVRLLSVCAGDGRDVIDVLSSRDDASRVDATLLEMDPKRLADLVPNQAGLRFCRCPGCEAPEGDDPLAWSIRKPGIVANLTNLRSLE